MTQHILQPRHVLLSKNRLDRFDDMKKADSFLPRSCTPIALGIPRQQLATKLITIFENDGCSSQKTYEMAIIFSIVDVTFPLVVLHAPRKHRR